jgi:hypothetical protein
MLKRINLLVVLAFFLVPSSVALADATPPISPGCHASTPAEQQRRRDLGLPAIYQTCPGDTQHLGIGQGFEQFYAQLRTQSPCNRNTCTLSCRTKNTGAQVCGPVATRFNAIGCHPNNRTAIFPTNAHGFAAHITLLRNYCSQRGLCTISRMIATWAPASHAGNQPAVYAATVSRWAQIPVNQVINPNDIDVVGRLAVAMSCFEAGALPYPVEDLKQGLVMAAGGPQVAVPPNVGALLNESLTSPYTPNAYQGNLNGNQFNGNAFQPSPGGGMNPLSPSTMGSQSSAGVGSGTRIPPPAGTQLYSPNTSQPVQGGGISSHIIVWPKTVARGQTLTVAWTSVNIPPNGCKVFFKGAQFAQSNEGSKQYQTISSDTSPLTFTLECKDSTGQLRTLTAASTLQN